MCLPNTGPAQAAAWVDAVPAGAADEEERCDMCVRLES